MRKRKSESERKSGHPDSAECAEYALRSGAAEPAALAQ